MICVRVIIVTEARWDRHAAPCPGANMRGDGVVGIDFTKKTQSKVKQVDRFPCQSSNKPTDDNNSK